MHQGEARKAHIFSSFSLQRFGLMLPSPLPSRAAALREAPHTSFSDSLFLLLGSLEEHKALGIMWLFQVSLEKELN